MRPHPSSWLSLVLLAAFTTACNRGDDAETVRIDPPPAALGVSDQQQPTPGFDLLQQSTFQPGPAATGQVVGRATLMMPSADAGMPDGMQLEVRLEGMPAGEALGWHIFMAPCGQDGPVVVGVSPGAAGEAASTGTEAIGQPLIVGQGGMAQQTVVLPTAQISPRQLEVRDYSVRVYQSLQPEPARMIGCANLGTALGPVGQS
jgi:hypothetical protein